jgi:hypothetical protein
MAGQHFPEAAQNQRMVVRKQDVDHRPAPPLIALPSLTMRSSLPECPECLV